MSIVLLGAPGAGKDTLADALYSLYGLKVLTTGALYRKEKELATEFGMQAYAYWGNGNLCPDEMTNELMARAVANNTDEILVFNGYPRTVIQGKFLDNLLKITTALILEVDDETATARLLNRGRIDDSKEVIKTRLNVYHKNNKDLMEYYESSNRLIRVNATNSPKQVLEEVVQLILN